MSWSTVALGEVAEIVSGSTPKTGTPEYWEGDIPWVAPADLTKLDAHTIADTPRKLTQLGLASCGAKILPVNSVLFSSRAPIGHVAITGVPMATNQGFKSFVPNHDKLEPKFLFWWLKSNKEYLQNLGVGATFKEVSKAIVSGVRIPLPPLPEQRRIVSILDQTDALRAKRRRSATLIQESKNAIFHSMFPRSNFAVARKLGEVATVKSGSTPDRSRPEFFGGPIPWVKTTEVQGQVILTTEESVTQEGRKAARLQLYPAGSVLIAMYGQGKTRGQSATLGIDATVNQACAVVLPGDQVHSEFLAQQIRLSYDQLRGKAQGGNQPNLNLSLVRDLDVMVPTWEEQQEFVTLSRSAENISGGSARHLAHLDELFASLQSRAFKGEL